MTATKQRVDWLTGSSCEQIPLFSLQQNKEGCYSFSVFMSLAEEAGVLVALKMQYLGQEVMSPFCL